VSIAASDMRSASRDSRLLGIHCCPPCKLEKAIGETQM
jgi:hypothetical protein